MHNSRKLNPNPESIKSSDKIIVIGTSAGGLVALKEIFMHLNPPLSCAIIVVLHRLKNVQSRLDEVLQYSSSIPIKEAEDKEKIQPNTIYLAPSNYHVLVERDHTLSLSVSEPVNFSRPSIDVTFISVGEVYKDGATGIILTGANRDGAAGLQFIEDHGGECIVQDPAEAQVDVMPQSAIASVPSAKQLKLQEIVKYISSKFSN